MLRAKLAFVLGCGTILLHSLGWAQYPDYRYPGNRNGGRYSRGGSDVIERVKRDVHAMAQMSYRYVDNEKRDLFRDTIYHLERFQYNAQRGRFDTDRLDGAIDEMKRLVRSDQIRPQMKSRLARNIEILRNFRASGGGRYGYGGRWSR
jgi:hypothetical protein